MSLAVAVVVYAPSALAMTGLAVWVAVDAASQRVGRHRAPRQVEVVSEETLPLPVGRWR